MKKRIKKKRYVQKGIQYFKSMLPKYFRYPKEFYEWHNFLKKSQLWSREQLIEYQWDHLTKILLYSYQEIPYYQKIFKELNATPDDFKSFNDFKNFPFLTKKIVKEKLPEFLPKNIGKKKLYHSSTGGSTGEPLAFYEEKLNRSIEKAFIVTLWNRVGFEFGDLVVVLRGASIPNDELWDYNPLTNTWLFSSFKLSNKNINEYVTKINKIKPKFVHGYPSFLWVFASLIEENNLSLNFSPKAILSGSENLYPYQRKMLERVFHCKVFSWLGLAEHTVLAGECENSHDLHLFSEHSYVELVDHSGKIISENGITGELIGTSFHNYVTPFIRYKTGDMASYSNKSECSCGRNYLRIKDVHGRTHDFVYNKNSEKFPVRPGQLNIHGNIWVKVRRLQIVQNEIGELIIKVEKSGNFSEEDIKTEIIKSLSNRYNDAFVFKVIFTDHIERTRSGKHKFLIQNLKTNNRHY